MRGEGVRLYDADGREYLDLLSGIGVASLGHAHPGLARAIADQAQTLLHTSNLFYHPLQGQLAERLANLSGLPRAFFCNSGTEAVEACLKFARRYWYTRGEPRAEFVALEESFHGRTFGSLSVTSDEHYRAPFEPLLPGVTFVPANDPAALAGGRVDVDGRDHRRADPGRRRRPAADAGVRRGDQRGVRDDRARSSSPTKCRAASAAPAIRSTSPALGLKPHLVSVGKALGGGVPVGAALVSEEVADTIAFGDHGSTYGGNLLACRAALCVLDELVGGGLLGARRPRRPPLRAAAAAPWRPGTPIVKEVRGAGLMWGLELDARRGAGRPGRARARRHRQPHGGDGRPAAAAARHHRSRGSTKRSAVSMRRSAPSGAAHDTMTRRADRRCGTADASRRAEAARAHRGEPARKGHLLPRDARRAGRRTPTASSSPLRGRTIVGCAELAPLSPHVAEVRSLVVDASARGQRRRRA